jgi:serine/threonine-protein kinase ULK/ATG1
MRDGLALLHQRDIIHRDLKPQNLLLASPVAGGARDAFVLKIADFGFARELQNSMAETMCGSPLFMAVEVLRGERYTESADLWSTGAILYYMLTGRAPFRADTTHQLHRLIETT